MSVIASIILNCMGFDISIPKNIEEFNLLPFCENDKNNDRFETEHILRECAMIDWLHFKNNKDMMFCDDKMAGLVKQVQEITEEQPDWLKKWLREVSVMYAKYSGRKDELRRLIIKQTDELFCWE